MDFKPKCVVMWFRIFLRLFVRQFVCLSGARNFLEMYEKVLINPYKSGKSHDKIMRQS